MSQGQILAVFCYDIAKDKARLRTTKILESHANRVQESVFEGWMGEFKARALAERISMIIEVSDSLRLYLLAPGDAARTVVYGATPPVEDHEFYLL